MKINSAVLQYHNENRYTKVFGSPELQGKKDHVHNVVQLALRFATNEMDKDFLAICAEHHDDGRAKQYELLGKFWDTEVSHNALGVDCFDRFLLAKGNVEIDSSVLILRDVMLYHGRATLAKLSYESKPYVDVITAADDFENSCTCISYLLPEVRTDAKGYYAKNPEINQKEVSDFVWQHFVAGEKFDKIRYCKTYGEYILFAATLALDCINQHGELARVALMQPSYGYESILDGFKAIFSETLQREMGQKAYEVMKEAIID